MPDENTTQTVADCERNADGVILMMLTVDDCRPWSVEEVIREYGERGDAIDALNRLYGHGLIHRTTDDFVWATRAAIRSD
jgi:hypothetical protein